MRIPLGRCLTCDRLIYEDEGKIAVYLYDRMGLCRECVDKQQEADMRELAEAVAKEQEKLLQTIEEVKHGHHC